MGITPNYAATGGAYSAQGGAYPAMGSLPPQGPSSYGGTIPLQAPTAGADMFYRAPTPPGSPGTTFAPQPPQQPTVLGPTYAPIGGYAGNPPPMPTTLMPGMEAVAGPGMGPMMAPVMAPPPGGAAGMALRPEDMAMLQAMIQNPQIAQQVFQQMGIPPEAGQQILAALSRGEMPGMSPSGMAAGMPAGPPSSEADSGRFQPAPGGGYRDTQPGKSVHKRGIFGFIRDHILIIGGLLVAGLVLYKRKGKAPEVAATP